MHAKLSPLFQEWDQRHKAALSLSEPSDEDYESYEALEDEIYARPVSQWSHFIEMFEIFRRHVCDPDGTMSACDTGRMAALTAAIRTMAEKEGIKLPATA